MCVAPVMRVDEQLFEEAPEQDVSMFFEDEQQQPYEDGKWIFPLCIFYSKPNNSCMSTFTFLLCKVGGIKHLIGSTISL